MSRSALGLLERRLIFVTGKGGVGKTSSAAAIAWLAASRGQRTLVCEVDAKGNLADFLGVGPLRFDPLEVRPNLFAMAMDTEASMQEYLRLNLRIPLVTRLGPIARTFDFVASAAPGVKEILTVGKLAYEVRERNYDLVVVDASATGHVVGQLASPVAINDLVKVGLVRAQTDWMIELLTDANVTGVVVVTIPEEMPTTETLELLARLRNETDIDVASVLVNRVLPEIFSRPESEVFDRLREPDGAALLRSELGDPVDEVVAGAELAVRLRRSRVQHLTRLREGIGSTVPLLYLPFLFHRAHGVRATSVLAQAISDELGY